MDQRRSLAHQQDTDVHQSAEYCLPQLLLYSDQMQTMCIQAIQSQRMQDVHAAHAAIWPLMIAGAIEKCQIEPQVHFPDCNNYSQLSCNACILIHLLHVGMLFENLNSFTLLLYTQCYYVQTFVEKKMA